MRRAAAAERSAPGIAGRTSLLICLAGALLPLADDVPWWLWILVLPCLLLALARDGRQLQLPRVLQIALAGGTLGIIWLTFGGLNGRAPGTALLVAAAGLKALELHRARDENILLLLIYLLIGANFLFDQRLLVAGYLTLVCLAALVLQQRALLVRYRQEAAPAPAHAARAGAAAFAGLPVLLGQALPLALVLFLLFPRIGPLWGVPQDGQALTGFSERMQPGSISELARSDAPALRVQFLDPPPPPTQRYWRGLTLWDFDGRSWSGQSEADTPPPAVLGTGPLVRQRITLEPHGHRQLPGLDRPVAIEGGNVRLRDLQPQAAQRVVEPRAYRVSSRPSARIVEPLLPPMRRARALALPVAGAERARALAARWRAGADRPETIVASALAYFRQQPFHYTLRPPLLDDPIDDFLFRTRRGFCEHYAGSFVFLMRAAGLPARVVVGYQGGRHNPLGDYYLVRQSDAHAWAEVHLPGRGWVRVDPTAAVAPARVEAGAMAALPAGTTGRTVPGIALWNRAGLAWDAAAYGWQRWVLGYGEQTQQQTLRRLGLPAMPPRTLGLVMLGTCLALLLLVGVLAHRRHTPAVALDPATRSWQRSVRRLTRIGLPAGAEEGPLAYARRVVRQRPDLAGFEAIAERYAQLRYGPPQRPARRQAELLLLRHAVQRFRPRRRPVRVLSRTAHAWR